MKPEFGLVLREVQGQILVLPRNRECKHHDKET